MPLIDALIEADGNIFSWRSSRRLSAADMLVDRQANHVSKQ